MTEPDVNADVKAEVNAPAPPLRGPSAPAVEPASTARPARRAGGIASVLLFILIVALAAGEGYLYQRVRAGVGGDTAALQAQIDTLNQKLAAAAAPAAPAAPVAAPATADDDAQMLQKFAALAAQVSAMQSELAADHGAVTTLQASTADLGKLSDHIGLLNKVATARMALDDGQPLGPLPNAPPALAQFATTPAPTEASLRLGFADAARAAESASVTADGKSTFWSRALARVESIVTVSDGTHVLLGAPAAGVLAQARLSLDAGDLAGAVRQIGTLSAPTQAAMGAWLTQARALLAARAALIQLAAQA